MRERVDFSIFNKYVEFFEKSYLSTAEGGYHIKTEKVHVGWGRLIQILPDIKSRAANRLRPWSHRLIVRYFAGIKEGQQAIIEGQAYIIDHVVNLDETCAYQELRLIKETSNEQPTIH
jgi:hypothetical protein